jgi:hypothetical protein
MFQHLKIFCAVFTLSLSLSGLAFAAPKDKYHGGAVDARQHGYEHGYRDGLREGIHDRDHHDKFKPNAKDADAGYEKYMGDKGKYKDGYRAGFAAGYDDGFNNRPVRFGEIYGPNDEAYRARGSADRYDDVYAQRGWAGSDVAYDIGYRDGLTAGNDDYSRRHSTSAEDQRDYKDADHGYRSGYGDRDSYKRQYRDGFVRGYKDGYRGIR